MNYLVAEVRGLLGADACAVLLTGDEPDTLYFRAASGWSGDPVGRGHRVPADESTGSGQAMRTQGVVLIEDLALQQPPLWTPEWLAAEGFRAAAIVPLVADGRSIGTLIIDSRQPRPFSEVEVRLLRLMANQAALAIEKARLHHEEIQRQRIEEELSVGRNIQRSMLPAETPQLPGWQFATDFEAARHVGGDFYDYFPLPGEEGRWGLVMADVSDTGVPAALFMALSRTTIRNLALRGRSPVDVITWANRHIQEDSQSDMFLTVFYAELDTRDGRLTYANAGHNPPLLWRANDHRFETLDPTCPLLGVLPELTVEVRQTWLGPGDVLVLYTDGIVEAFDDDYVEFGRARLEQTIRAVLSDRPDAGAADVRDAITATVNDFSGSAAQTDDKTLLIIKRGDNQ
jgi:sigma-B regulation protein RsbU (phosphoserine phosphatase)